MSKLIGLCLIGIGLVVSPAGAQQWLPHQANCTATDPTHGKAQVEVDLSAHDVHVNFGAGWVALYDPTHSCGYHPPSGQLACDFSVTPGSASYAQLLNCDVNDPGAPVFHLTHGRMLLNRDSQSGVLECQSFHQPEYHLELSRCVFR